jgi:hypothetical protein
MNSAQLVNLIIEKLRRVEFLDIETRPKIAIKFLWGHKKYLAFESEGYVTVRNIVHNVLVSDDIYTERIEGMLNGLVRNEDGELVQP